MILREVIEKLGLTVHTGADQLEVDVTRGYMSDMLSDVMGNAPIGSLWITMQKHKNIVAVAVMKSLAGIILVKGRAPDGDTMQTAREEGVVILSTEQGAFDVAAQLHQLGVAGD